MTGFSFRKRDMISSKGFIGSFSKVCTKGQFDSLLTITELAAFSTFRNFISTKALEVDAANDRPRFFFLSNGAAY